MNESVTKTGLLTALFTLLFTAGANAQQSDRIEVFAGYSYTGYSVYQLYSGPWTRFNFNGWEASATAKLAPHVGVEGDFGGGYGSSYKLRTYMGGPRVSAAFGNANIYGHVLFGGLTFENQGYSRTTTSFAMAVGGGADWWFSRHVGARLIQADYLRNTNSAAAQTGVGGTGSGNNFRISTGIVFRF